MKKKRITEKVVLAKSVKDLTGKQVFTDLFGNKCVFVNVEEEEE